MKKTSAIKIAAAIETETEINQNKKQKLQKNNGSD